MPIKHASASGDRARTTGGAAVEAGGSGAPCPLLGIVAWCHGLVQRRVEARIVAQARLLDESHDAVLIWRLGGGIVYWNRRAAELYGWSVAEAQGRDAHELLMTRCTPGIWAVEQSLARDEHWEGELVHRTRDGAEVKVESRWVVVRRRSGFAYVLETNRDVTAEMRGIAALQEREARFRAIFDAAADAIITIDERGVVESMNPAGVRLFGYAAAEVVGHDVRMLMPEPYRGEHDSYLERYRRTGEQRMIGIGREVAGRRKDGSTFPLELAVSEPLAGDRRVYTGILRDVSERKRSESERDALLESERTARSEAERAVRLKDDFVATVSHELRTPLNAILGYSGLLKRNKDLGEAAARAVDIIERNARVQAQLIEDLLDTSRLLAGKLRLDVEEVDLAALVEDAVVSVVPAAEAKSIRIERAIDPCPGPVDGDPARLAQVVGNLLSNALKFTPKGGRVEVILRRVGSHVELVVRDTGTGITPDFLPFVFERFRRSDSSTTRAHQGLGLGLALVKQLVELHGGTVSAESPGEGHGATFTARLPISTARRRRFATMTPIEACESLAGTKVLVVDDEDDARNLVRRILEDCYAEVVTASSAREALDAIGTFAPDVVVSDIGMPETDGYQLLRTLRARGPNQGGATPAVALTAYSRPGDRARALEAGYQAHLAKPVDQGELLVRIASIARRGAGAAA